MDVKRGASQRSVIHAPLHRRRGSCPHLASVLDGLEWPAKESSPKPSNSITSTHLLENWKFLLEFLHLSRLNLLDVSKVPALNCEKCVAGESGVHRLHLCVHCAVSFCFQKNHLLDHFTATPGHFLAVDTSNDHPFCSYCSNYVTHPTLHEIATRARHFAIIQYQKLTRPMDSRIDFVDWVPDEREQAILRSVPKLQTPLRGLRGLSNLGNTCFMNAVLQSLVSNPMMTNYFLADAHNRNHCPLTRSSRLCLGCETDLLIENMFNGERAPFSPHQYLLSTWRCTDHLAGYEQQDAHDFYISTMNAIHTHIGESLIVEQEERLQRKMEASHLDRGESMDVDSTTLGNLPADIVKDEDLYTEDSFSDEKCVCVTHKAFAGFLRSDVHCLTCHNISTVKEAFLDISLDMETLDRSQIVSKGTQEPLTLYDGLERFTQIETLDSFHCDACHTRAACTKQLSIEQLPLTLCFHLKRFKHTFTSTRKIDTYMQFPLNIDMTPYTFMSTSAQGAPLPKAFGEVGGFSDPTWESLEGEIPPPDLLPNGINPVFHSSPSNEPVSPAIGASKKGPVPRADRSIYSLYAVVNHSGNTENGHYTSFVRHGDSWFKCDDHAITKATVKEVLVSRAYLLFYCRSVLEYQE